MGIEKQIMYKTEKKNLLKNHNKCPWRNEIILPIQFRECHIKDVIALKKKTNQKKIKLRNYFRNQDQKTEIENWKGN